MTTFFDDTTYLSKEDDLWQGDDISSDKDIFSTRIMFHNVNGLTTTGIKGMDNFAHEQELLQVDIQGFSEHCLDTEKFQVQHSLHHTLHRHYPGRHTLQIQSSAETAVNQYKPGGTGILAIGKVTGRQEPNGKGGDPLGRWSYLHLRRQGLPPVTIISAYQVCSRPTNLIGNTAYHQQIRALSAQERHDIHPRQAFIQDLSSFVHRLHTQGHAVILGGDFNESLEDKDSGILKLITTNNLTDPFLYRFPQKSEFGTHVLGKRRIDAVFVTQTLLSSVSRIGYTPFQYSTPSDHRSVMIEFNTRRLFGQDNHTLYTMPSRIVRSNDRKVVTDFVTRWYEEIVRKGGFQFQDQIDDDKAQPNVVEMVDAIITTSSDTAETACGRRRPEFYSHQLVQRRIRVSILRGHLNALRMGKDISKQLHRRMARMGLAFQLPPTQHATKFELQQAKSELQETCRHHMEVRQEELQEKIDLALQKGQKTRAKIMKAIKTAENNRRTYRILAAMKRRTQPTSGLDRVEIPSSWPPREHAIQSVESLEDPKTCKEWRLITQPQDIEYYLMLRNRLHFGQAQGTPFTVPPMKQDFDWAATTSEAEQLLHGSYHVTSLLPNCIDLLQACQAATTLDGMQAEITLEEFAGKIKTWRENTTTSPSGRHLGRYKALFVQGYEEASENDVATVALATKQAAIAGLILSVLNYCIRNTYVLERWKKIVNVMIFKEPNNYKIHRLRVIHIYEADFNLILAVKWRRLLRTADAQNLLNDGQYGGRPGCEAQSLTLLEELKYDLSYLTRRTLFNFDNDATSCYDRIIVSLASIINRKYGMHRKTVAIHAETLKQAQFHLKTATGVSTTCYSPSDRFPIYGTGQGSGNSPTIWLFISSTLFDIHNSLAHGVTFVSPDGNHKVRFSMVGFVDDSTGTCNDFQPQQEAPLPELIRKMEHDAQLWSNLLYCTGGKLELPKCSFHVLRFHFRPNGTPIPIIDAYENRIQIIDMETLDQVPIPSKRAFEPHKMLGHLKSPYSKQHLELQNLKTKANRISLLLSISPITRQGAFLAYTSIYLPSIQYVLPQSFFERHTLDTTQAQSMHRIIAKCGFNRHTARALIFAPKELAGGGFLPWYLLQGEGQIKHFLKHWRTDTVISKTLRVATAWAQWQAGHEISLLEDPYTPIPYLECRWLKSLREFLQTIDATIIIDIDLVAKREKQQDQYIMTLARESGKFSRKELAIVNYCRLYLHVTTISELFDAEGTKILPQLFECRREPWFNPATIVTLQERPSWYQIRTQWQKLCRQITTSEGFLAASINLGKWTISGDQLRRRRQTYIDHLQTTVYHWNNDQYWEYQKDPNKNHEFIPIGPSRWQPAPGCTPIIARESCTASLIVMPSVGTCGRAKPCNTPIVTFGQYINTLPAWEQRLLHGIQLQHQPYEIRHKLHQTGAPARSLLVSDGSKRSEIITYGWVFGSEHEDIYAKHAGDGFGEFTSHRAEAWGMLSGLVFIHHLFVYTHSSDDQTLPAMPVTLLTDNSGLVSRVQQRLAYDTPYPNATLVPDWDIVEQIVKTMQQTHGCKFEVSWVKGHQDETAELLTVEAKYNVIADALAGGFESHSRWNNAGIEVLPAERCRLQIQDVPVQGHYAKHIRHAYTTPAYHRYLEQRYGWTDAQISQIDWQVFQRAASSTIIDHVQLMKLVYDKLPTNSELAKVDSHHPSTCSYCAERETFHHLLQCTNPTANAFRARLRDEVAVYLSTQEVPEPLAIGIQQTIQCILGEDQDSGLEYYAVGTDVESCVTTQQIYGSKLLQGFIARKWRDTYENLQSRYGVVSSRASIDVFSGLIRVLWKEQLTFWNAHTSARNSTKTNTSSSTYDKLALYKSKVRHLHLQRDRCLPGHRDQYFYPDLESFLQTATSTQLKQYLHHYEPAIHASIQKAKRQPIRTILTYPGFIRLVPSSRSPGPRLHQDDVDTPSSNTSLPPHHSTSFRSEVPGGNNTINRKHTRWKSIMSNPVQSIRRFFTPKPD